jgi:ATP-dependent 26S proteasome regulatory subunit
MLIDEVESMTAARKAAASGLEPSDALRVVNALLTQIDKFRHQKNVSCALLDHIKKNNAIN